VRIAIRTPENYSGGIKNSDNFIPKEEVQRVCQELGIRDWTKLTDTKVQIEEARVIQATVGSEALQIPVEGFQQGLEVTRAWVAVSRCKCHKQPSHSNRQNRFGSSQRNVGLLPPPECC
jgi:hypothetical protein